MPTLLGMFVDKCLGHQLYLREMGYQDRQGKPTKFAVGYREKLLPSMHNTRGTRGCPGRE
jgi:hypothetical protein